ncbi:hypothetical protein Pmani_015434 [Petrolisthes manimaculis]|uniref:CID domain-containing protein n=1 Tax=Petrolisthes manimaculis TaxID=1843537 RepID=A0AAE1U7D6_9EUCA|nr:hypothetical protein Pmani_015434 [Petrolisthes manimaculis]
MDSRSLEKRLTSVKETSDDIQQLSRWCLQHKNHYHSIIQAWSRALRKSKVHHRLTLFYVCNDIVQNCRRKKVLDLVQHFATAIKESTPLVRDEKIRPKIIRIFNIWEERGIYDAKFISELTEIVENVGTVNATENDIVLSSFQPVQLVESIRSVLAIAKTTDSMLTDFKNQDFSLNDEEINQLQQTVKERGTSRERMEEFEEAVIALECYMASVQKEVEERTQLVTLLEQAEIFYETQRGEAKLVANAYKNFGNRVKNLKSKLEEKMKMLPEPSPVPSPTVDAPSPENSEDEDLSLPDAGTSGFGSFMNSSKLADFAKEALTRDGGNDLESRLAAFREGEPSSKKGKSSYHEIRDVRSPRSSSDSWEIKDVSDRYKSHNDWESQSIEDVTEVRSSWEVDTPVEVRSEPRNETRSDTRAESRDYAASIREHRGSRSSRDSRDSRESGLDTYRSSRDRDRVSSDRDYHKSREHEYATSYDTPIQMPKELKPMSAAELLDTFGKAYQSNKATTSGSSISITTSAVPSYSTTKSVTTSIPDASIPDLSRPPPLCISGSLPSNNTPTTESPSPYIPATTPSPYSNKPQYYPTPLETSPKPLFPPTPTTEQPPYPPYSVSPSMWIPPPPPPPPPPEICIDGVDGTGPDYDLNRSYNQGGWSDFEQYSNAGDVPDDSDDRNWGEPPGKEELEALDTPSSPPTFEKGFSGALPPPPLPPAFCTSRSNLRELVSEGEDSDHRTNLVSIQPRDRDSDYRCYDYSFLSDHAAQSKGEKIPSIQSLFTGKDDMDLRVKKSSQKQSKDDSGSDMDISASEDDMDISDESAKEAVNNKKGGKSKNAKEPPKRKESNKSSQAQEKTSVKKSSASDNTNSSILPISVIGGRGSKSGISVVKPKDPSSTVGKVSEVDKETPVSAAKVKEGKKTEKRKSMDSEGSTRESSSKPNKMSKDSGASGKKEGNAGKGRKWYDDFKKAVADSGEDNNDDDKPKSEETEERNAKEDPSTSSKDSTGSESNVIEIIKSMDREFHQQKARGKNFNSSRGGGNFTPHQGNGSYYGGSQHQKNWSFGVGPGFFPRGGRGGGYHDGPRHGSSGRPYGRGGRGGGRWGGGRGGRGGRNWW